MLDTRQFASNLRPAIDVGLNVSRVGGKAQTAPLRAVAGRLRLDYAQFLELETFTKFGGPSDTRPRGQIARGQHIRELLRQPRVAPLRLADQIALLATLGAGAFDDLPADAIATARRGVGRALDALGPSFAQEVKAAQAIAPAALEKLVEAVRTAARSPSANLR